MPTLSGLAAPPAAVPTVAHADVPVAGPAGGAEAAPRAPPPPPMLADDDEDIFSDAGRAYVCEPGKQAAARVSAAAAATVANMHSYFGDGPAGGEAAAAPPRATHDAVQTPALQLSGTCALSNSALHR
jgi:hypothetical protein